jgi:type I restriction enzyme S subunit
VSTWSKRTLSDLIELQRGHDLPTQERKPGPIPIIGSFGVTGTHGEAKYTGPGVAIGRSGASIGQATFVDEPYWPLNTCLFVKNFNGNDPRWIYRLLDGIDFTAFNSGSAQPSLNRNFLRNIPVAVPPLDEQRAIAEVLGSLDDKIAANTKLAQTSANLAQALFAGSMDAADHEVALSEVTELLSRGVAPKYSDGEDAVLVLNQKCVRDQRVNLDPARRTLTSKVRGDKMLRMDDVLVNSTGQGTLGRVARWTNSVSVTVDSHITIARFDPAKVDPVCAGMALLAAQKTIEELGEGSTGQTELSRTELGKLRMRLPDRSLQAELGHRIKSMSEMETAYLRENQTLATTRDALLPQVMSGKLRVKDAESVLEKAGV